jgi:uncharacterized protein
MQAASDGARWMLRLERGEEVVDSIASLAQANGIRASAVGMGIGQLTETELGFWTGTEYERRVVREPVELVSLSGSIAEEDGRPSVHLHASVGTRSHSTLSGHLFRGTVGVLAEVLVVPFPALAWERPMNESVGLRILDVAPAGRRA